MQARYIYIYCYCIILYVFPTVRPNIQHLFWWGINDLGWGVLGHGCALAASIGIQPIPFWIRIISIIGCSSPILTARCFWLSWVALSSCSLLALLWCFWALGPWKCAGLKSLGIRMERRLLAQKRGKHTLKEALWLVFKGYASTLVVDNTSGKHLSILGRDKCKLASK